MTIPPTRRLFPGLAPYVPAPGNSYFATAYAIAAVTGVISVFMSPDLWLVPSLSMLVYLLVGHRRATQEHTIFEFADSVYYLGFTLSIGSLLASLDPFSLHGLPDTDKIFHYFGLGMFTTLIGVVCRTVLQQYYRLPSETLDSVNDRLAEQSRGLVDEIILLRSRLAENIGVYATTASSQAEELANVAGEMQILRGHVGFMSASAGHMRDETDSVVRAAGALRDAFDGAAQSVESDRGILVQSVNRSSEVLESAASSAASSLHNIGDAAEKSAEGLRMVADSGPAVAAGADQWKRSLGALTQAVADANGDFQRGITGLDRSAEDFRVATDAIRATVETVTATGLAGQVSRLSGELEGLLKILAEQRRESVTEMAAVRTMTESAMVAADQLHRAVTEIATSLAERLEVS